MNSRPPALAAAAVLALSGLAAFAPPSPPAAGTSAMLTWTQHEVGAGTWAEVNQQAATYAGEGYSDWRLPTIDELQSALKNGTYGQSDMLNATGWKVWSDRPGTWAYCCLLYTDAIGTPNAPSGVKAVKEPKNGLHPAKFVRP